MKNKKNFGISERPIGKTVLLRDTTRESILFENPIQKRYLYQDEWIKMSQFYESTGSPISPTWKATRHSKSQLLKSSADRQKSYAEQVETILQSRKMNSSTFSIIPLPTILSRYQHQIRILKDGILIHPSTSVIREFGLRKILVPLSFFQRMIMEEAVLRMNSLQISGRGAGKTFQYLSRKYMAEVLGRIGIRYGNGKTIDAGLSYYPKEITAEGVWGQIQKVKETLPYPDLMNITKEEIENYLNENY